MESFSTLRPVAVPWVTNLATLAVVLGTTWWSNGQRPSLGAEQAGPVATTVLAPAAVGGATATTAPPKVQAPWPAQAATLPLPGMKTVAFATDVRR